ncbi:MAG: hypothetical protein GY773_21560 [Actinomycetia bacterium]|nr:hypothetical protein [Actinomycetes bacterium]
MSWWETAPPLELMVPCSEARHRLAWSQGEVVVVDHPELDAERTLMALGGPEPACLSRLGLWEDAVADGGFLAEWIDQAQLTDARLSWLTMALERMRNEGFHEFLRNLPFARAERMGHFLSQFPRPWHDRAAAAVAEAIVDGEGVVCNDAPQLLPTAIASRLRHSFVTSVGGTHLAVGVAALVPLTITVDDSAGNGVSVAGALTGPHRRVAITVAGGWLHQVWGAGAALVDSHLVLDRSGTRLTVLTWTDHGGVLVPQTELRMARVGPNGWLLAPAPGGMEGRDG